MNTPNILALKTWLAHRRRTNVTPCVLILPGLLRTVTNWGRGDIFPGFYRGRLRYRSISDKETIPSHVVISTFDDVVKRMIRTNSKCGLTNLFWKIFWLHLDATVRIWTVQEKHDSGDWSVMLRFYWWGNERITSWNFVSGKLGVILIVNERIYECIW